VPHRGKINQPAFVRHVAEEIAALRGIGVEEVAAVTTANFFNLVKAV
jgi:TatD DNase family protein